MNYFKLSTTQKTITNLCPIKTPQKLIEKELIEK